MTDPVQRIKAAVVDGRCRTPRYIQKQLSVLHAALVKRAAEFHQAIVKDTRCTSAEAWLEILTTVQSIKSQFEAINFNDSIQQEYSIANGKDNDNRRLPFGCVYIVPWDHNRLYSIIQPSVAAIAAGNCVVIELQNRLLGVDQLLKTHIQQSMDKDAFVFVNERPTSSNFFTDQTAIVCASQTEIFSDAGAAQVLTSPQSRTIAVVDRSADIQAAAKSIVEARVCFCGKSAYAPDIVLVNEFAIKEFCQSAAQILTQELSNFANSSESTSQTRTWPEKTTQVLNATTLISGVRGSIHLVQKRTDAVLSKKTTEPQLIIVPISSLDDAIDLANENNQSLLAAYYFADPKAAKYLSQFIISDLSLTNFIPPQLLIGPPSPKGHAVSIKTRYSTEMLSFPSPELIKRPTSTSQDLGESLVHELFEEKLAKTSTIGKVKAAIQTPLPAMGEPAGKSIGFFEQGLFTGLGIGGVVFVGGLAVSARYAVPAIMRRL